MKRRRLIYGAAIVLVLVWLAGAGPLGAFMGRLSEVQSNDNSAFLPVSAESTEVQRIQEGFQEDERVPAIVVYSAEEALTPDDLAGIAEDAAAIEAEPWASGQVIGPVPGPEDDSVAQLVVPLAEDSDTGEAVGELRALLDGRATGTSPEALVTGPAGFAADISAAFGGIDGTLLLVALAAVLVILIAVYRSPLLPVVVILSALLALALSAALVYVAADAGWIQLNGQSQGILFILVVGACTDYALLLVSRYREELQRRPTAPEAVRAAVRGTVEPILASGGTVILGVLCLLASDLASNRGLGPVAALGIAAALVSALTFLPAVLLLLGRAAFWPVRPRYEGGSTAREESTEAVVRRHRLWGGVATAVARRPRLYWVGTALVLVVAAAFVPQFRAEGTSQVDVFRTEVDSVAGQEVLERGFGSESTATPAVIAANADHLDEVVAAAEDVDGVSRVVPVTEGGAQGAPAAAGGGAPDAEPKVVDDRVLVEATLSEPAESTEAIEIVRDLRAAVHEVEGADALVGGTTASNLDTLDTSSRDLVVVVPLVLGVVLLVLVVLLRSIVAPVLLVLTTVVSFGSALGVGALVFNHVLGFPGADPVVPLFAFVFLVALGIDYNIFLMTRVREETLRHGHREGVLRGLTVTGGVITSAGVVLAATFAALGVIPVLFLVQLAFLVAFGVLLDALIVRSLLVPALTLDLGRWMWWPGAPFRLPRK
ncbi:putative drug exporter of the RND superfamily [Marinactinospora thermotolerans DSM 45154]|uniref:Putative drug exporter of the RND superfamily n=2 Tax=Marinactinospora thermotolerans TaxID=531310 RepID=A0A1T4R3L7_9ACTN|nr:putative drug exporter of the RND superfamily [Marinactinospora thermotolerans DSM 45154]